VLGMMRPFESMVRGEQMRAPLIHCLQLMNCVVEAILERYRF
jgi:hypothetical protein